MSLLDAINQRLVRLSPWARVLDTGADEGAEVVVIGSLDNRPKLVVTLTEDFLMAEQVTGDDLEQVFAFEGPMTGDWAGFAVDALCALGECEHLFPCIRFKVPVEKPFGKGEEGCYWEWMADGKSKVFTHWIVLPKEDSTKLAQKLTTRGFKRMLERVTKEVWRGNKKVRSEVEHEWHRYTIVEGEENE